MNTKLLLRFVRLRDVSLFAVKLLNSKEVSSQRKRKGQTPGGEQGMFRTEMASSEMTLGLNNRLRSSSNAKCCITSKFPLLYILSLVHKISSAVGINRSTLLIGSLFRIYSWQHTSDRKRILRLRECGSDYAMLRNTIEKIDNGTK